MGSPNRVRLSSTPLSCASPKVQTSVGSRQPKAEFSVFAADPSKAYFERFSLVWAPVSLISLLGGVFGTGLYEHCGRDEYLVISIVACLPGVMWPLLFPCAADVGKPYSERFWVKAAAWIIIFSFYGNYFWTHYFYTVLGASYLFDSYMLNGVPIVCYLCTFFYFTFYFSVINIVLRTLAHVIAPISASRSALIRATSSILWAAAVFVLSVLTALFEAVSIQHFPLYSYSDRFAFLTVGSVFYGIYFMIGFPMFFALDEYISSKVPSTSSAPHASRDSLWYVVQNALAAVALVTLLLDIWRLALGELSSLDALKGLPASVEYVPFIYRLQQLMMTPSLPPTAHARFLEAVACVRNTIRPFW
jgi:cycloeucalenol cycloisomerase